MQMYEPHRRPKSTGKYVCTPPCKNMHPWCRTTRVSPNNTRLAGLLGREQCRLPSAQKCEWFTRDGPQLFVAISLICTRPATTLPPSFFFCATPFCPVVMTAHLAIPRFICILRSPFKVNSRTKFSSCNHQQKFYVDGLTCLVICVGSEGTHTPQHKDTKTWKTQGQSVRQT